MAVHAYEEKIKVATALIETVFNEGYRYLDRCGEALVRIRRADPMWDFNTPTPQGGQLRNEKLNINILFNAERLVASAREEWQLIGAETKVVDLAKSARLMYEIINDSIEPGDTTRVAARFRFSSPADSLEEADRFVTRGSRSDLAGEIERLTASSRKRCTVVWVVEDVDRGLNRRVEVGTFLTASIGRPAYTGIGPYAGECGAFIDIDTFTRPDSGSYDRLDLFVNESYATARRVAVELFQWLRQRQK